MIASEEFISDINKRNSEKFGALQDCCQLYEKFCSCKKLKEKEKGINVNAIESVAKKFAEINRYIESGEEVPSELTKNFITFDLSDDPYKDIE